MTSEPPLPHLHHLALVLELDDCTDVSDHSCGAIS
jgi:hypothetical protein